MKHAVFLVITVFGLACRHSDATDSDLSSTPSHRWDFVCGGSSSVEKTTEGNEVLTQYDKLLEFFVMTAPKQNGQKDKVTLRVRKISTSRPDDTFLDYPMSVQAKSSEKSGSTTNEFTAEISADMRIKLALPPDFEPKKNGTKFNLIYFVNEVEKSASCKLFAR